VFNCLCRNYDILKDDGTPEVVHKCIEFLRSEAVFLILSNLTGLRLHRLVSKIQSSEDDDDDVEDDDDAAVDGDIEPAAAASTVDDDLPQLSEQAVSFKRRRLASPSSDTAASSDIKEDEG